MSEQLKALNNIRSLRVLARENSLELLESIAEKLAIVIEEKREAEKAQNLEKAQELEKAKRILAETGMSVEEFVAAVSGKDLVVKERKVRAARPAKYKFTDEFGNEKTWTGQGRTPKAIQLALDAGKSLADFEI